MPFVKKYEDPQKLVDKIDEYIALCQREDKFPSYAGLCLHCGIISETMNIYADNNECVAVALKKAQDIREEYLANIVLGNNAKSTTGAIFLLKQPKNGGYQDKQISDGNINVNIGFKNLDKKAFD